MARKRRLSDKQLLKQMQRSTHQNLQAYMFLLPWLIGFVIFSFVPFIYTFYLSFQDVTRAAGQYVIEANGLGNYAVAFFGNEFFVPNLISFIMLEITYVPAIMIISFIIGILLNRKIKFRSGFRTIFFLPVIVLSSTVLDQLYSSGGITLSDFSGNIVFETTMQYSERLAEALLALFENFTMVLWFTGIPVILFINGLQKINQQLYEAAKIDGATTWQILWKITVPIIKPTALIVSIFTIVQIGMFNVNPLLVQIRDAMYNSAAGLGLTSAYTWVYTLVVLMFVGIAILLLGTRNTDKNVKLTSIQRRQFEMLKARRDEQVKESEVVANG